jgi:predicted ATPase
VVLNGPLTSLGKFDDLKSCGSNNDQICIKFSYSPLLCQNDDSKLLYNKNNGNSYPIDMKIQGINCELSFDVGLSDPKNNLLPIQPRLYSSRLDYSYYLGDDILRNSFVSTKLSYINYKNCIKKIKKNRYISDNGLQKALNYPIEFDKNQLEYIKKNFYVTADIKGCEFKHFLPSKIVSKIDTYKEVANSIVDAVFNKKKDLNDEFSNIITINDDIIKFLRRELEGKIDFDELLSDVNLISPSSSDFQRSCDVHIVAESEPITIKLADLVQKIVSSESERSKYHYISDQDQDLLLSKIIEAMKKSSKNGLNSITFVSDDISIINSQAYLASLSVENFFTNKIKYFDHLRCYHESIEQLHASNYNNNNIRYDISVAIYILELYKNKIINYIPSENFIKTTINNKLIEGTLEEAVIDWLKYCEVASSFESQDNGKLGHELRVGVGGADCLHDLGQVGGGVSQVLPILVMCLIAEPDSTLIFEHPELHLHPTVQFRLADFFLSIVLSNKQCIVETHSEYIISRLRYRIASAPIDNDLSSQTKIYFVEKNKDGSHFHEVVVNQFGAVVDWPDGFFDETPRQASDILLASVKIQKALRGK